MADLERGIDWTIFWDMLLNESRHLPLTHDYDVLAGLGKYGSISLSENRVDNCLGVQILRGQRTFRILKIRLMGNVWAMVRLLVLEAGEVVSSK